MTNESFDPEYPNCGENYRGWYTPCGSGCFGIIQNGVARSPTESEFNDFREIKENRCNSLFPQSPALVP